MEFTTFSEDFQTSLLELIESNDFEKCLDTLIETDELICDLEQKKRSLQSKIQEIIEQRRQVEIAIMRTFFWSGNSGLEIKQEEDIYHNGHLISIDAAGDVTRNIQTKPIRELYEVLQTTSIIPAEAE